MRKFSIFSYTQLLLCLLSSFVIPGLGNDNNSASKKSSGISTPMAILFVLLGFFVIAAFSIFLYKLWERKKREEQYARLLKLFEQDDELEVELGMRD